MESGVIPLTVLELTTGVEKYQVKLKNKEYETN